MKWILLSQEIDGIISYISHFAKTEQLSLSYEMFMDYISTYPVKNWIEFKKEVNCYKSIFVNLDTGDWEVQNFDKDFKEFTFEQLYEFNKENPKEKTLLERGKEMISGWKKDDNNKFF